MKLFGREIAMGVTDINVALLHIMGLLDRPDSGDILFSGASGPILKLSPGADQPVPVTRVDASAGSTTVAVTAPSSGVGFRPSRPERGCPRVRTPGPCRA